MKKRKTKNQKIIASLRRQLKTQDKTQKSQHNNHKSVKDNTSSSTPTPTTYSLTQSKNQKTKGDKNTFPLLNHPQLIKKDIIKTALLSILILSIELAIFFYTK